MAHHLSKIDTDSVLLQVATDRLAEVLKNNLLFFCYFTLGF